MGLIFGKGKVCFTKCKVFFTFCNKYLSLKGVIEADCENETDFVENLPVAAGQ